VEGEEMSDKKFIRSWTPVGAKKPSGAYITDESDFTEAKGYTKKELKDIGELTRGQIWQYEEKRPGYSKEVITIKRVE
jgi:hypothetical protein